MSSIAIIPAILSKDWGEIKEKIRVAEGVSEWLQIDIADGDFVPNETWRNATELKELHPDIKIEMHLMVAHPEREIQRWVDAGVARLIAHIEAFAGDDSAVDQFVQKVHAHKRQVGLALNPATPIEVVVPYLHSVDVVLFLSVEPGFSGQPFDVSVVEKVRSFHHDHPEARIAVDGGMTPQHAIMMVEAGATMIASGSSLWSYPTLQDGIDAFQKAIHSKS